MLKLDKETKEWIGHQLLEQEGLYSLSGQHVQATIYRIMTDKVPPEYRQLRDNIVDSEGVELNSPINIWIFPKDLPKGKFAVFFCCLHDPARSCN